MRRATTTNEQDGLAGLAPASSVPCSAGSCLLQALGHPAAISRSDPAIELLIPLARGQSPYAPKVVITNALQRAGDGEGQRGESAPGAGWRGTAGAPRGNDCGCRAGEATSVRVGARTTAEVHRQGSRVSLCAGLHVVRVRRGSRRRVHPTGYPRDMADLIHGPLAWIQNAPPGTRRRRGENRSFFSARCTLGRVHLEPEACVEATVERIRARDD